MITIEQAVAAHGIDVLDHLDRQATIPVHAGIQAQGDLLVVPLAALARQVTVRAGAVWQPVGAGGVEVLRGTAMGNSHTLVAAAGAAAWTTQVDDAESLALGVAEVIGGETAYLAHAEHGYIGLGAGRYVIRRQREQRDLVAYVED